MENPVVVYEIFVEVDPSILNPVGQKMLDEINDTMHEFGYRDGKLTYEKYEAKIGESEMSRTLTNEEFISFSNIVKRTFEKNPIEGITFTRIKEFQP